MITDGKIFIDKDGLDSDTDSRFLPMGHSRYRLCCRSGVSSADNTGIIENIEGNVQVAFTLAAGTNKCIGTVADPENSQIYFFIANDPPDDIVVAYTGGIWRYNINTNVVQPVLLDYNYIPIPGTLEIYDIQYNLNFDLTHKIINPAIINGLLYWTDGYNPPRTINIEKSVNFCINIERIRIGNFTYVSPAYTLLTDADISHIKKQPSTPQCYYTNIYIDNVGNRVDYNNLRGHQYQFAYRYKYYDNEYSRYSSHSLIPLPTANEDIIGSVPEIINQDNCISVIMNTGIETVISLELVCKINDGNWCLIDIINKYDNSGTRLLDDNDSYAYWFLNNKVKTNVYNIEVERLYDPVGYTVGQMELIDGSHMVHGDIEEGQDNVDIQVNIGYVNKQEALAVLLTNINVIKNDASNYWFYAYAGDPDSYKVWYDRISFPSNILDGAIITITCKMPGGALPKVFTHNVTLAESKDVILLAKGVFTTLTTGVNPLDTNIITPSGYISDNKHVFLGSLSASSGSIYDIRNHLYIETYRKKEKYYTIGGIKVYPGWEPFERSIEFTDGITCVYAKSQNEIIKTAKSNMYHNYGLVYKDEYGRCGAVNVKNSGTYNTSIFILPHIDANYLPVKDQHGLVSITPEYSSHIYYHIYHQPPLWANTYQWVVQDNSPTYFSFIVKSLTTHGANQLKLEINSVLKNLEDNFENTILDQYTFTRGDRIRFIAKQNPTTHEFDLQEKVVDAEIVGMDTSTPAEILINNFNGYASWEFGLVEIYTPIKVSQEGQDIFYEIGDPIEIIDAGSSKRRHAGGDSGDPTTTSLAPDTSYPIGQDQTISGTIVPATGFLPENAYLKIRYTTLTDGTYTRSTYIPVESSNYSDFYPSNKYGLGKVNTTIPDYSRERKSSKLIISSPYLQDTKINGLNTFSDLTSIVLEEKYGAITGIRQIGYTLKVLQVNKNTSFYISRSTMKSSMIGGNDLIITTEDLIGTKNISEERWGTKFPESVCVNNRYLYFWDGDYGQIIRDTPNGMLPVSDYFMKTEFREIADSMKSISLPKCYINYNDKYEELNVTFVDDSPVSEFTPLTYVFHEPSNRWKSQQPYVPEMYGRLGNTFVSYKNGTMWKHDTNAVHNNFYGVQYKQKIGVTGNKGIRRMCIYGSIELRTSNNKYNPATSGKNWRVASAIIPPSEEYPNGMSTYILPQWFKTKEGGIFAEFPRDTHTPLKAARPEAWVLLNGRYMRGEYIDIILENEETDRVTTSLIIIKSELSPAGQ